MLIFVFSGIFASIAPVSGTPKLGFGTLPSIPVSLIDFHGIDDFTQPYDLEHSQGMPHFIFIFFVHLGVMFYFRTCFLFKGAQFYDIRIQDFYSNQSCMGMLLRNKAELP